MIKILCLSGILLLSSCMYSLNKEDGKILIVYVSRTRNTAAMAQIIQKNVGGDLVELQLETPYPSDYQAHVDQVARENADGYLPPLKTKIEDINAYDVVFVGFPTWGMQLPPPMKSFLSEYKLGGKKVVPFNTHAGFGVGSGFRTVKELCNQSQVLDGLSVEGGYEKKGVFLAIHGERAQEVEDVVEAWLKRIDIIKE